MAFLMQPDPYELRGVALVLRLQVYKRDITSLALKIHYE
jgi:hypothetical protein